MKAKYLIILAILLINSLQAQIHNDSILKDFNQFLQIPESSIYMHLNKSILLEGEDLGFTGYVYSKKEQKPFKEVKNLYCQLLDSNGDIVKEQMMLVEDGRTNGTFVLDSLVPAGNYSVRGFTNWMKNFESPHYFETPIKVLNSIGKLSKNIKNDASVIHVLPEGGHLVNGVLSTIGLKVDQQQSDKSESVFLIINGEVKNEISLDSNGIGRFSIVPNLNDSYGFKLEDAEGNISFQFPKVERQGIVISVKQVKDKLFVKLNTNEETLNTLNFKDLSILMNGVDNLKLYDVQLVEHERLISLSLEDFTSGVNQITLMTRDKEVISKRLFFNYNDFNVVTPDKVSSYRLLDTITTSIAFKKIDKAQLSISVHPVNTISINKSQSIVSSFKLYPYLYGTVTNPLYYFKDITKRKQYDMDNLLLCLGWEMYDWDFIFDKNKLFKYNFEEGIAVNATINKSKTKNYIIHPSRNTQTTFIDIPEEENEFAFEKYLPTTGEKIKLSEIDKKGKAKKTKLYLQFFPSKIPYFNSRRKVKPLDVSDEIYNLKLQSFSEDSEELDTVVLSVKVKEGRQNKIRNISRGRVQFFTDQDRLTNFDILQYLRRNGLNANRTNGELSISFRSQRIDSDEDPVIVINGIPYFDVNILTGFDMSIVDYIELDSSGFTRIAGSGQGGIINIVTDPLLNPFKKESNIFSSYDVPLTFSPPTKFYRPSYYSYNDDFFDKLGVIDWQGDIDVVNGKASFKMPYLGKEELLLHIQGWTEDGELIDEYRTVNVGSN